MATIRFDDVAGLTAEVTQEYGPWGPEVEISQSLIEAFAELSGDRQWIHVDVERARRESPFGGTIAHGFLTLSLLGRMRPPGQLEITGYGSVLNYGSDSLRFLGPVPAGSKVHARARLCGVQAKKSGTLITTEVAVHVVGSERPALVYQSIVLYLPPR
jgi:acyl dehydratase